MVELTSTDSADQVEARLREALDAHGLQLFARIDHAAGGRKAEVELEPNVLLIFGNVHVGTPLMKADPRVGIELPLRMLVLVAWGVAGTLLALALGGRMMNPADTETAAAAGAAV